MRRRERQESDSHEPASCEWEMCNSCVIEYIWLQDEHADRGEEDMCNPSGKDNDNESSFSKDIKIRFEDVSYI